MKSKLGEDESVINQVKTHLKEAFKNRWFKKGYKAAAKGKNRSDNPYTLPKECWILLRKRTYWDMGFEQKAFSPTKKKLRKIAQMREKERDDQLKRIREEKLDKLKKKEKHKKKHGKHKHRD